MTMPSCSLVYLDFSSHLSLCQSWSPIPAIVLPHTLSPQLYPILTYLSHFHVLLPTFFLSVHDASPTPHTQTPPSNPPARICGTHHCSDRATLVIIRDIQLWK